MIEHKEARRVADYAANIVAKGKAEAECNPQDGDDSHGDETL